MGVEIVGASDIFVFCIYIHTSPSGKSYLGQTCNYAKRCHTHKNKKMGAFGEAITKYGWSNFTHTILMTGLSLEDANELEEFFISWVGTMAPDGYNLKTGGSNSIHGEVSRARIAAATKAALASPEIRARLSASGRARAPASSETRAKISASARVALATPDAKAKMSATHMGNTYQRGRVRTDEARAKMSAAQRIAQQNPERRAVAATRMMGNQYTKGLLHKPEARAKIAAASKLMWIKRKSTVNASS